MTDLPQKMIGALLKGVEQIEIREFAVERPGPEEIILAIKAATTCGTDVKVFKRGGHPRMLEVPALFGHEMAGNIAAIGPDVNNFKEGDEVVVANSAPCQSCVYCQHGRENLCTDLHYLNGAFAEYIRIPARFVRESTHRIPPGLPFHLAALTEPLACVLHGINACELKRFTQQEPPEIIVFGAGPIGLLFVGALATSGYHVVLADPNKARLDIGSAMGARKTIKIERGGGQADAVRAITSQGQGAWVAIDATGVSSVWLDAINSVRAGGLINLFGGCAPGSTIPLDTHLAHYSELTIKGVYHHRPETIRQALNLLTNPDLKASLLLSAEMPIERTEEAIRSMIDKKSLKVIISGTK